MRARLNRLRRTSFDELRVRGSQLISAFAERQGWSRKAKVVSDSSVSEAVGSTPIQECSTIPVELLDRFESKENAVLRRVC